MFQGPKQNFYSKKWLNIIIAGLTVNHNYYFQSVSTKFADLEIPFEQESIFYFWKSASEKCFIPEVSGLTTFNEWMISYLK